LRRYDDRFSLILNDNFTSEWFSSSVHELYLYITVVCNQHSYPLITIRVTQKNSHAPQFYGQQPYSIVVDETAAIGSKINTSVLAVDWDSTTKYSIVYDIVNGNEDGYFELDRLKATIDDLNNLSIKFDEPNLNPDETPYFAALIVKKRLDTGSTPQRFNFNISATVILLKRCLKMKFYLKLF
uniref:Cadherin domain-containing protein n=1 Tax=Anisakis simplex TaxID=6269 RepID=A0A0M3KHA6_ANISI